MRATVVDYAGAGFEVRARVADATGAPLDEFSIDYRRKIGERLGLDAGDL